MRRALVVGVCALLVAACSKEKKQAPAASGPLPAEAAEIVYGKMKRAMIDGDLDYVAAHTTEATWAKARGMSEQQMKELEKRPELIPQAAQKLGVTADDVKALTPEAFLRKILMYQSRRPGELEKMEGTKTVVKAREERRVELELTRPDGSVVKKVMVVEHGEWKLDGAQSGSE